MTFSDTEMMELGRKHPTNIHNTRSLIRTLRYVLDILQTGEVFTVEEYKANPFAVQINPLIPTRRKTWQ